VFCKSLFVLLYFFFSPLCCLAFFDFTTSDYPFGIFKLFFGATIKTFSLKNLHKAKKNVEMNCCQGKINICERKLLDYYIYFRTFNID